MKKILSLLTIFTITTTGGSLATITNNHQPTNNHQGVNQENNNTYAQLALDFLITSMPSAIDGSSLTTNNTYGDTLPLIWNAIKSSKPEAREIATNELKDKPVQLLIVKDYIDTFSKVNISIANPKTTKLVNWHDNTIQINLHIKTINTGFSIDINNVKTA